MAGGLISALGLARLKAQLESLGRYAAAQAALTAVLVTLAGLAAVFGVAALTIWLAELFGAALALAIVAAGFLVAALITQLVITVRKRRRAQRAPLMAEGEASDQAALGSIAMMAVVGYLLGRRFERR
jgi:uncharacterized PurR-regulated membrane protein YhhQ (DUF165 family)